MVWIKNSAELLILLVISAFDIRSRKFPLVLVLMNFLIALAAAISIVFVSNAGGMQSVLLRCLCALWIGGVGWIVRKISGKGIGAGDILVISGLPLWHGSSFYLPVLLSMLLCGVEAVVLLVLKKRDHLIPYMPFLLLSEILLMLGGKL